MSDPREELREAIARAILTPDEWYYSDRSLFDTDWYERERALQRADCVLRTIDVNKDLVLAVMGGKPEWNDLDELPGRWQVDDDLPTDAGGRRQAVEEAIQRARRGLPWRPGRVAEPADAAGLNPAEPHAHGGSNPPSPTTKPCSTPRTENDE